MNTPPWLRCDCCLWWQSFGCTVAPPGDPTPADERCRMWVCQNCMESAPIDHTCCSEKGRPQIKVWKGNGFQQ